MTNSTRNTSLRLFLDRYELAEHEVARQAAVPRMTLWRAVRGQPITQAHAAALRKALWQLSGDFYTGSIATGDEPVVEMQNERVSWQGGAQ